MNYENGITPAEKAKIIGILLLRNEDVFIERIITNIADFCDEIIVADNKSTDKTPDIIKSLEKEIKKIRYHFIDHPSKSHDLICEYTNKPVWIFAVDGDELYDAYGLELLRRKIIKREFDDHWMVLGNVLNCVELDEYTGTAKGYLAPPCRSMTKLYNFNHITEWSGRCPERLHGGKITFKKNSNALKRFNLHEKLSWDESYFRCLHLCFLRRSSKEKLQDKDIHLRRNISDKNSQSRLRRFITDIAERLHMSQSQGWKKEKYMKGDLVIRNISKFFNNDFPRSR